MILVVTPTAGLFGGTERVLQTLLGQLDGESEFAVYFLEDGPLVELAQERGVRHKLSPRRALKNVWATARQVGSLRSYAREVGAKTLFAWTEFAQLYAGPASLGLARSVWWQRGGVEPWMARLQRLTPYSYAIGNSRYTRDQLRASRLKALDAPLYPVMSQERFGEADRLSQPEARRRVGLPPDRLIVGSVGRMQRWKGFDTFVDALARVREDHPEVLGLIVGGKHDLEAEYEPQLKERIARAGLTDHVLLPGSQHDIPVWMSAMDVFVHTSHNEPFGVVTPEALSLGLPVIASGPGGPAEVIDDGRNGLLVRSGDVDGLAHAVRRLVTDRGLRESLAGEAPRLPADFLSGGFADRLAEAVEPRRDAPESNVA